jgi:hypothetical protein
MAASGKSKGGEVWFFIKNNWCAASNVKEISSFYSPDTEYPMVSCRPFYLPREFSSIIITAVYIPPQANATLALNNLSGAINKQETSHPEQQWAETNAERLKTVLSHFYQHVSCTTSKC